MSLKRTITILVVYLSFCVLSVQAQSLQHPVIFTTEAERAHILELIDTYSWASTVVSKTKSIVDGKVATHINNPASILGTIPALASDDNLSETQATTNGAHAKVMLYASYSGMLYHITREEKYAQFSADILSYYIDALEDRPVDKMAICGNYFYDARTSYGHFAIAYDFIHDFLTKTGTQVYVKSTGKKVDFDNVKAQKVIRKLASNALQEHSGTDTHGKTVSNHPILRAPGTLFCILCVENDTERERLFDVFWDKGTSKQNSFKNTILPMFGEQGIWPESLSYSFMPGITMVLNVIDRIKPEMNVMTSYMNILEGNFLFDYLRNPNRTFVRYGDSKRNIDQTGTLYRYTLDLAVRRGFTEVEGQAKVALRQAYNASGGYSPSVSTSTFNAFSAFPLLFWGVPVPAQVNGSIDFNKPTVIIKHAGLALQRNYVEEKNTQYGLCGIIGGAHYVHSHLTGIAMELYGQGYVMGPNAGLCKSLADRSKPEHTDYFRLYAGNNTVIVNGTSHGLQPGSWKSDAYVWMNTTKNIAAEPKHLQEPVSKDFSFATQFLDDNVNNCDQQRTLSTIRTSETTAYYFDMFRSKSLSTNKFHDYVYHNIGDETHITDAQNNELPVSPTTKYQTYYNDPVKSPGWRFFEDTEHTDTTDEAVNVRFDLNEFGKYMHLLIPSGVDRQYTKALGPATREGEGGYLEKKTQIIAIRQEGEAWNRPFVAVFEPSENQYPSVNSVRVLESVNKTVGAVVESIVGQKMVTDYIISNDVADETLELEDGMIRFKGRFAVVRKEEQNQTQRFSLYIGEGTELTCFNEILEADEQKRGFKVVGELDTTYINHDIEIEAEDFDAGGEGVAYHDNESFNYGTAKDYRETVGVDMINSDVASNGIAITRVRPGEWLNYTFNVENSGAYFLGIRASNPSYANAAVHAYVDDSLVVSDLGISRSGHWNIYATSESANSFLLDSGEHVMRIAIKMADFNFDKFILRKDLRYNSVKSNQAPVTNVLKIMPNPNKGAFTLQLDSNDSAVYKIYTLNGKEIKSGQFMASTRIDISDHLSGVYVLNVIDKQVNITKKLIVKP